MCTDFVYGVSKAVKGRKDIAPCQELLYAQLCIRKEHAFMYALGLIMFSTVIEALLGLSWWQQSLAGHCHPYRFIYIKEPSMLTLGVVNSLLVSVTQANAGILVTTLTISRLIRGFVLWW